MTGGPHFDDWRAPELGLPKAAALALLLAGPIIAFCFWAATAPGPNPVPQAIEVTEATLTQLPKPAPVARPWPLAGPPWFLANHPA